MSNLERQRRFRERNPGHYQRLHARQRAELKALSEQRAIEKAIRAIIAPPMQLCLPAPDQVSVPKIDFIAIHRDRIASEADALPSERPHSRWRWRSWD